jgi:hypothetical protein
MGYSRVAAVLGLGIAVAAVLAALLWSRPGLAADRLGPDLGASSDVGQDAGIAGDPSGAVPGNAPSGNPAGTGLVAKIGLQAGHWQAAEAPPPLNTQTGASGGGKTEAQVNLTIAQAAAGVLREAGYTVDILPTVIPRGYQADLVVAIHADGGASSSRGFFVDTSTRRATAADEAELASDLVDTYRGVGIPYVNRSTRNSHNYYGYRAVSSETPMVLIETGFLTNRVDQAILIDRPDLVGASIARGIESYLGGRI